MTLILWLLVAALVVVYWRQALVLLATVTLALILMGAQSLMEITHDAPAGKANQELVNKETGL